PIERRRALRADRRRIALARGEPRRLGIAHHRHALRVRQPAREPLLALRKALRVRVHLANGGQLAAPAHQALADRQHHFAADLPRRREQEAERPPDPAFRRIPPRPPPVAAAAGLDLAEYLVDRRTGLERGEPAEVLGGRFLAERALRAEIS